MLNETIAYFNSNDGSGYLATGCKAELRVDRTDENALEQLQAFIDHHSNSYVVIALSYDLKNSIEELHSVNPDNSKFPLILCWVPDSFIQLNKDGSRTSLYGASTVITEEIIEKLLSAESAKGDYAINMQARTSKEQYLRHVQELKNEIQLGNIYEVNYCQEYYADNIEIKDPVSIYHRLNEITAAPFSAFINTGQFSVMCGSPERYISKTGTKLITQPIKGTIRRGKNPTDDEMLKQQLLNDPKERSENVMIVDLVRNDLSRVAEKNSVNVDELFGIYTFRTVHQMISTVSCEVKDVSFTDILRASFPMGSMTGAPKISAMQLIDEHEDFARGIYSGSLGFIRPNGDFDLNVVIRSLIYNRKVKYLSCPVGGAITIQSVPEKEYEECQVKVRKILDGINAQN